LVLAGAFFMTQQTGLIIVETSSASFGQRPLTERDQAAPFVFFVLDTLQVTICFFILLFAVSSYTLLGVCFGLQGVHCLLANSTMFFRARQLQLILLDSISSTGSTKRDERMLGVVNRLKFLMVAALLIGTIGSYLLIDASIGSFIIGAEGESFPEATSMCSMARIGLGVLGFIGLCALNYIGWVHLRVCCPTQDESRPSGGQSGTAHSAPDGERTPRSSLKRLPSTNSAKDLAVPGATVQPRGSLVVLNIPTMQATLKPLEADAALPETVRQTSSSDLEPIPMA